MTPEDLQPEYVLGQLEKGQLSPFYLFYGPNKFRLEKVLSKIREVFVPEAAREFNLQVFYGDDAGPGEIIEMARSLPFISQRRLVIVRGAEGFSTIDLEGFIPYLDKPVESTCLIFVSSKPNFNKKFYRKMRALRQAVNFKNLNDRQIISWIRMTARDLGFDMQEVSCAYLKQIVGNRMIDLHSELEKLYIRYGETTIGIDEIKELIVHSRTYTIFELMDEVSFKRCAESLSVLSRFLQEEGRDGAYRVLGMLNRQIRLLWQTKSVIQRGGGATDVAKKIHVPIFLARKIVQQSSHWSEDDLEGAFLVLYQADNLLKSGSQGYLVLENVVLSLCLCTISL